MSVSAVKLNVSFVYEKLRRVKKKFGFAYVHCDI